MEPVYGRRPLLALLVFATGLLHAAPTVRAADEEVRVTLVAILATDRDHVVDAKLKEIADEVRKKHPGLTGFRLGPMTCKAVVLGKREVFELVEGQLASVLVLHAADKNDMVCLKVKVPLWAEFTYSTVCGKFFPIMTRYQTKDKERLIIAICVHCCDKEKKPDQKDK